MSIQIFSDFVYTYWIQTITLIYRIFGFVFKLIKYNNLKQKIISVKTKSILNLIKCAYFVIPKSNCHIYYKTVYNKNSVIICI